MPPLVPTLLPALDAIRAIRGILGLNPFTVTVTVRRWTGQRVGDGVPTDTKTALMYQGADGNQYNVTAKYVTTKEVAASGGIYRDRDIRVGRVTPVYAASIGLLAGGFGDATFDPPVVATTPTEIFWNVAGPGMPSGGGWCDKVQEPSVTAMHYEIVLRATGRQP